MSDAEISPRIAQFSPTSDVTVVAVPRTSRYRCVMCSICDSVTTELDAGPEAVRHFAAHREVGDLVPPRVFAEVSKKERIR